jgi:hypothetical protein
MSRGSSWFKSTVIEPDPREDAVQKMAKIGFREYSDYGDKQDAMGKYFGFSENVDEHIGHYSLRIQPPGTYTSGKPESQPAAPPQDENPIGQSTTSASATTSTTTSSEKPVSKLDTNQDESDMKELDNDTIKFVTERKSYRNIDQVRILNNFGANGGFEHILKVI